MVMVMAAFCVMALEMPQAEARSHKKHHHYAPAPTVSDLERSDKYAAFVGEPDTGRVLLERRPDEQRYPASLTKMMTLYELFKALDQKQIRLSDPLKVTAHASIQAPSKLGLDPGDTIRVEDAIKAIVVVSANDVAVTIAENLGGTEDAFAARMTADARALGMKNTHFANASGLPDDDQLSTARDMYILARHLIENFPQYYDYFGTESFRWAGRRFANHNHLVGRVAGVDGMKTGYIRASGFHLVASAKRDGHRLICVVMGGDTSRQRDAAVKRMLDTQFAALEKAGPMVAKAEPDIGGPATTAQASGPYPRPKPGEELALATGGGVVPASGSPSLPLAIGALPGRQNAAGKAPAAPEDENAAEEAESGTPESGSPPQAAAQQPPAESGGVAALLVPQAQAAPRPPQPIRWGIQIGAYVSAETANSKLAAARKAAPKLLGRASQSVAKVAVDDTAYYRARFGPLGEEEAKRACAMLEPHGFKCFTIQQPEAELASTGGTTAE
jgi:D-alanyl-D-alanine carboxypeptidase